MSVNRLILQHLVCPYPFSTNYRITRVASSGGRVFALGAKCRGFKSLVALSIISKITYLPMQLSRQSGSLLRTRPGVRAPTWAHLNTNTIGEVGQLGYTGGFKSHSFGARVQIAPSPFSLFFYLHISFFLHHQFLPLDYI